MDTLIQQPGESILYKMDMTGAGALGYGDTIAAVTSVVTDGVGLTITDISHNGDTLVYFRCTGGTLGTNHKITVTVTTAVNLDTLQGDGILRIVEI